MKYIGLLTSSASGKLGGVVASHNRNGQYFRKHSTPTQPRTASQKTQRNLLASLSSQFKSLTSEQISGWNALGATVTLKSKLGTTYHPTGQQLFVSCNRHLNEIGVTDTLTTAPSVPSFSTISAFTITQGGTSDAPANVTAITVTDPSSWDSNMGVVIKGSSVQSLGRSFFGKSLYRTIGGYQSGTNVPTDFLTIFKDRFGPLPQSGIISFKAFYVDPASGFKGSDVNVTFSFYQISGVDMFSFTQAALSSTTTAVSGSVSKTNVLNNNTSDAYSVNLSATGVPSGVSIEFATNPLPLVASGSANVVATATTGATGATAGSYPININATYGTDVATYVLTLILT